MPNMCEFKGFSEGCIVYVYNDREYTNEEIKWLIGSKISEVESHKYHFNIRKNEEGKIEYIITEVE